MNDIMQAYNDRREEAHLAYEEFVAMVGHQMPRVPGCGTAIRLAWRMHLGATREQAVAREYMYRWSLALRSTVFGVPGPLGM